MISTIRFNSSRTLSSRWHQISSNLYIVIETIILLPYRPIKSSIYTKDILRNPRTAIQVHQNLQLLLLNFNGVFRDCIFLVANNVNIGFSVSSALTLIKFHDQLDLTILLGLLMVWINSSGFLIISYMKLGEVNQRSKQFHDAWKRKAGYLEPSMKIVMKKFIRSSRPLRIELGDFGYYNKSGGIRILGKLVTYTVKFLMLTNKFGI